MTELSLNPELPSSDVTQADASRGRWKRPAFALALTLLVPGLGQFYNRQTSKAAALALLLPALYLPAGYLGAFHHFASFVGIIFLQLALLIAIATDAFRTALRQTRDGLRPWNTPVVWRVAAFLLVIAPPSAASEGVLLNQVFRAHAYRVPSTSNCPTVCKGERMIVDPSAYRVNFPQRGDLVMFQHPLFDSLLFKRVVGLPGDVVTQSGDGLLVNGKPAATVDLTHICGNPPGFDRSYAPIRSKSVTVPPDSLYVVGDNWSNSMDSRFEEFGFVSIENVRGRPLFLYWSPYKNRIGCQLR